MHYDVMAYRSPYEAYSLLLQVTYGHSHIACTLGVRERSVRKRPPSLRTPDRKKENHMADVCFESLYIRKMIRRA